MKHEKNMISIIVPVYNASSYLRRCVDSILSQSYADFELLLINDGSTDCSKCICDEYATKDVRIRVFHRANGGVSSARNYGIEHATGEWITFIDSDDWVKPEYLSHLIEESTPDYDLIVGGYVDEEKVYLIEESIYEVGNFIDLIGRHRGGGALRTVWGKLFKKSIIRDECLRFDDAIRAGEDSIFVLQYLYFCNKVKLIGRCDYNYRSNNGANTFGKKYDMTIGEIDHALQQMVKTIDRLSCKCKVFIDPFLDIWIFTGMFQITHIKDEKDMHELYLLCSKYVPELDESSFCINEYFSPVIKGVSLLKQLYEERNYVDTKAVMEALFRISTFSNDVSLKHYKYKDFQIWYYLCKCRKYKILDLLLRLYMLIKKIMR